MFVPLSAFLFFYFFPYLAFSCQNDDWAPTVMRIFFIFNCNHSNTNTVLHIQACSHLNQVSSKKGAKLLLQGFSSRMIVWHMSRHVEFLLYSASLSMTIKEIGQLHRDNFHLPAPRVNNIKSCLEIQGYQWDLVSPSLFNYRPPILLQLLTIMPSPMQLSKTEEARTIQNLIRYI